MTKGAETLFDLVVLADVATMPAANESMVRFAQFAPNAPAVDLVVRDTGTVDAENVTFREASGYTTFPAGNYTFVLRVRSEPWGERC